jgi:two-component system, sensor histidine kinase PdtaS
VSLFTPNTDFYSSFYDKAKYVMAWRITVVLSIVFCILVPISILAENNIEVSLMLLGAFSTSIISFISLKKFKKFQPVFWIYIVSGTILIHTSLVAIHELPHYGDFFWIICVILLAFVGLGRKIGTWFVILNAIGIIYFFVFRLNHHIQTIQIRDGLDKVNDVIDICCSIFVITYLLQQYISFNTYSERELKKANYELSRKNEENITLVKEIHHRVKNNLQIVISLLRLQKGELKSDEAKRHFNEAINRIMVMSLIHKKLYQKTEMSHIEIKDYLKDLSNDVIHISNLGIPIKFEIDSEVQKIGLKTIVPLGLLINELLSNSIKHAFIKMKDGLIYINILPGVDDDFTLIYSDNGTWVEPPKDYTGFGLGLIQTLVEQLDGSFTRNQSEYTFAIKNLDN